MNDGKQSLKGIAIFSTLVLTLLLPVIAAPYLYIPVYSVKVAFLSTLLTLILALSLLSILLKREIILPRFIFILPLILLPVVALLSAVWSGNVRDAFFGDIFEVGTISSLIFFVMILLAPIFTVNTEDSVKRILGAVVTSSGIGILYSLFITLASRGFMGLRSSFPPALIGNYIDFSIFLGASIVLILCLLNLKQVTLKTRLFLWIMILLAFSFIGAVGFRGVSIMLGLFSLFLFVYLLAFWKKKSISSLFIFIISLIFIFSGTTVSSQFARVFGVNSLDVRPSFSATLNLVKEGWKENFLLGSGPQTFSELWNMHKPLEVNNTIFWNTEFISGSSFVATLSATLGILGLLSVLIFLSLFTIKGFKLMFGSLLVLEAEKRFIILATFLPSLFLWIFTFIYSPGIVVLSLTFLFTGLFAISLVQTGVATPVTFSFSSPSKFRFIPVTFIVFLCLMLLTFGYFTWRRVFSSIIYSKAVTEFGTAADIDGAALAVKKAISLSNSDSYNRALTEIGTLKMGRLLDAIGPDPTKATEAQLSELQSALAETVAAGTLAIDLNNRDYLNHFSLAKVYENLALRGISGAAENAKGFYEEAAKRSPNNPLIELSYGKLAAISGNGEAARSFINRAIVLKPNYVDAYFTLAQVEVLSQNVAGAIKAVEGALNAEPTNTGLYFQLGLLKYNVRDFIGAASAFENAIKLVPDYANAKYFLGLSYERLSRRPEAITQFEELEKTNPDNTEVKFILGNLRADKSPFTDAKPPVDEKPEKRPEPPIKEE